MDQIRFIFWEGIKALSVAILGLVAAKAAGSLQARGSEREPARLAWLRAISYAAILALVALGARGIGDDVAAEIYYSGSQSNLARSFLPKAYDDALEAVRLRPGVLRYWQALAAAKFYQQQFASLLEDRPVFESLSGGEMEEEDAYRFAACYYELAQYDEAVGLTQRLIRTNRFYAAPYVLQGMACTAQKKYPEAERIFLEALQIYPSQQAAVEGLAHVYFLMGDRRAALSVLNETAKHPFPSDARQRFRALKALYAQ